MLEQELEELLLKSKIKDEKDADLKKLQTENRKMQENDKIKSLELKHAKTEIDNLKKKKKNIISGSLKGSKHDIKEQKKHLKRKYFYLIRK